MRYPPSQCLLFVTTKQGAAKRLSGSISNPTSFYVAVIDTYIPVHLFFCSQHSQSSYLLLLATILLKSESLLIDFTNSMNSALNRPSFYVLLLAMSTNHQHAYGV